MRAAVVVVGLLFLGCGGEAPSDAGGLDAAVGVDGGLPDGGRDGGHAADGGRTDAEPTDAGPDAQPSDGGVSGCGSPFDRRPANVETPAPGSEFFVSPSGDDTAAGTRGAPWRTLSAALARVEAGDTVTLRAGTYHESGLTLDQQGRADAWIVVRAATGEQVELDGGLATFRAAGAWEPVDAARAIYRSRDTFPTGRVHGAWLIDPSVPADAHVQLIQYDDAANFGATHYGPLSGQTPFYNGPGIRHDSDGHFYVRLVDNPRDLVGPAGESMPPAFSDPDPNTHRIAVYTSQNLIELDGAAYLAFRGITFSSSNYLFDVTGRSHHLVFEDCRFRIGRYGFVSRAGLDDSVIARSHFNGGVMPNVHWTDVKNRDDNPVEAYPEFQSDMLQGLLRRTRIEGNTFRQGFDGMTVAEGSADVAIVRNLYTDLRDDAVNLDEGVADVELAYNLVWRTATGFSPLPSGGTAGPVHVHHNVIDNSHLQHIGREGNARGDRYPVWGTLDPFGSHTARTRAHWRIYNNTIVTRKSGNRYTPAGPANILSHPELNVYDNVFYARDDRPLHRYHEASGGADFDGNVHWQATRTDGFPIFLEFGDGGSYATLDAFRSGSGTDWERRGLELDPGFDDGVLDAGDASPAAVWQRYRPVDARLFSAGALHAGLGWPDSDSGHRGAVARCED